MARQLLERLGYRGYPAAGGLVGVDHIAVELHYEYAVMRFGQPGLHSERIGNRFRQTGGRFEKSSFHAVANVNRFQKCLVRHHGQLLFDP